MLISFIFFQLSLVPKLGLSESKSHLSIIHYNNKPVVDWKLNDPYIYDPFLFKIKLGILKLPFLNGETRTDLALKMAGEKIFTPGGGDRGNKPDVIIVITDGKHSSGSERIKDIVRSFTVRKFVLILS